MNPIDDREEIVRAERWIAIQGIYRLVLAEGWYISPFHDKWAPNTISFLLRGPDCTQRRIVRLPK